MESHGRRSVPAPGTRVLRCRGGRRVTCGARWCAGQSTTGKRSLTPSGTSCAVPCDRPSFAEAAFSATSGSSSKYLAGSCRSSGAGLSGLGDVPSPALAARQRARTAWWHVRGQLVSSLGGVGIAVETAISARSGCGSALAFYRRRWDPARRCSSPRHGRNPLPCSPSWERRSRQVFEPGLRTGESCGTDVRAGLSWWLDSLRVVGPTDASVG